MTEQQPNNNPENEESKVPRDMAIALYYTHGDQEKASLMVNHNYQDIYVFKVRFSSSDMNGVVLVFFNYFFKTLTDCYCVLSKSYDLLNFDIKLGWLKFEAMISEFLDRGEHDQQLVLKMFEKIKESFNPQVGMDLVNSISQNYHDGLRRIFSSEILHRLGYENVKVDLHFETISSLDMELNSKSSRKLSDDDLYKKKQSEDEEQAEEDELNVVGIDEDDDVDIFKDKDIKLVLDGSLILSPIKGMNITGLVVGDKIRIKLADGDSRAVQIARAFNAYKNGRMGPIIGEIVSFRKKPGGGYKIFVEITDGVFVRINEDEENIKVDFVESSKRRPEHLQDGIEKYVDKHVESQRPKGDDGSFRPGKKHYGQLGVTFVLFLILIILSILTIFAIALFL